MQFDSLQKRGIRWSNLAPGRARCNAGPDQGDRIGRKRRILRLAGGRRIQRQDRSRQIDARRGGPAQPPPESADRRFQPRLERADRIGLFRLRFKHDMPRFEAGDWLVTRIEARLGYLPRDGCENVTLSGLTLQNGGFVRSSRPAASAETAISTAESRTAPSPRVPRRTRSSPAALTASTLSRQPSAPTSKTVTSTASTTTTASPSTEIFRKSSVLPAHRSCSMARRAIRPQRADPNLRRQGILRAGDVRRGKTWGQRTIG